MGINLQNWLFWKRQQQQWNDHLPSSWGTGPRVMMGWNEVPVTRTVIDDPQNWDAFLIKLPANICARGGADDSVNCLDNAAKQRLELRISGYVDSGYIKPGVDNVNLRPGSYVVFAREYVDS